MYVLHLLCGLLYKCESGDVQIFPVFCIFAYFLSTLLSFSFWFYQIHFKYLRTPLLEHLHLGLFLLGELALLSFWNVLLELLPSSSKCITTISASLSHHILFHLLKPLYKDCWDYIRPTQVIHDNLLTSKVLLYSYLQPLLPCKVTFIGSGGKVLDIRENIIEFNTTTFKFILVSVICILLLAIPVKFLFQILYFFAGNFNYSNCFKSVYTS